MKNPLKTLEPNLVGRDFVVSDMHGCYAIFENLLKGINFDPTKDRIISVGDLVDRGAESLKCLSLISEPWFHSVLSNHEQMMLDKFNNGPLAYFWYRNGGFWGAEAYNDFVKMKDPSLSTIPLDSSVKLFELLPLVDDLPFLITVTTKAGKKFHILHAELPSHAGKITDKELSVPDTVYKLATLPRGDGDAFVWARNVFYNFYQSDLSNAKKIFRTVAYSNAKAIFNNNLSHIISGHTILQQPMTIFGQTNIDTGAYHSYQQADGTPPRSWAGLTCVNLDTWQFYKATETTFAEIEPFVVSKKEIATLKKSDL